MEGVSTAVCVKLDALVWKMGKLGEGGLDVYCSIPGTWFTILRMEWILSFLNDFVSAAAFLTQNNKDGVDIQTNAI